MIARSKMGRLTIVGLGPGPEAWVTGAANDAVHAATDILGYDTYVRRLTPRAAQRVHGSDNREELDRSRHALTLASEGRNVVVVSGGDPGVFAMAAAVFEAVESGPAEWAALDIVVEPGVTAMLAAAARLGAPLGHDFCAISLSDNLKPWSVIERRLQLASEADFVISLYNPASKARPEQIHRAFAVLAACRPSETVVMLARAVGRPDEDITVTTLAHAPNELVDMRTLVMIGSSATRLLPRLNARPWVYTPRSSEGLT
jgi:precorrin-3B C17-methyltransferase